MASSSNDQDLLPDQTEGFKVGEKKTMDEYNKLGTLGFQVLSTPFAFQLGSNYAKRDLSFLAAFLLSIFSDEL